MAPSGTSAIAASSDDDDPPNTDRLIARPNVPRHGRTLSATAEMTSEADELSPADTSQPQHIPLSPLDMHGDPTTSWFYTPRNLAIFFALAALVFSVAYNSDNLRFTERIKSYLGSLTAVAAFLVFAVLNLRDGPFRRPHPAFWRLVLATNVLYVMMLAYALYQDKDWARQAIKYFDQDLGHPLELPTHASACELTRENIRQNVNIFILAHSIGWFGKAVILRDYWLCWVLSVTYELFEYSLAHQINIFNECWWDHWILDVMICNWGGTYIGMKVCERLRVRPFSWRGLRTTLVSRRQRVLKQFTPYDWTDFTWDGTKRFRNYVATVALLTTFILAELNVFYLMDLLWVAPEHPLVTIRLACIFLWGLPAVRELYQYITFGKKIKRMGTHAWLLWITVMLELICIVKWSDGEYPERMPLKYKIFWTLITMFLITYPVVKFGYPALRRRWSKSRNDNGATAKSSQIPILTNGSRRQQLQPQPPSKPTSRPTSRSTSRPSSRPSSRPPSQPPSRPSSRASRRRDNSD